MFACLTSFLGHRATGVRLSLNTLHIALRVQSLGKTCLVIKNHFIFEMALFKIIGYLQQDICLKQRILRTLYINYYDKVNYINLFRTVH